MCVKEEEYSTEQDLGIKANGIDLVWSHYDIHATLQESAVTPADYACQYAFCLPWDSYSLVF